VSGVLPARSTIPNGHAPRGSLDHRSQSRVRRVCSLCASSGSLTHMSSTYAFSKSRDADIPKSSAETVARGILDGVESMKAEIFPDPMSGALARSWRTLATDVLEMRRSWQEK
jgi:hypothetical protein